MQDKWMNIGYENDELKPYLEPMPDFNDKNRLGMDKISFIFSLKLKIASFLSSHSQKRFSVWIQETLDIPRLYNDMKML